MRKGHHTRDLKFLGNCPICSKKFNSSDASKIEKTESAETLYVECRTCGSSVVLGVVKNVPGLVTTIGMLTDMKKNDIERFRSMPPISLDDILEMHKYLERK
ncbi:MAG: hypothetical protein WAP23_03680 [Candidatus Spechtbacterales bacterium]